MNREIYTVKQFVEKYPAFTLGGMNWRIFNREKNGLKEAGAVLKVGRRVLIDADRYFEWIDAQNNIADV